MSRTENAIRNTKYAFISKVSALILGFISRTVFVYFLGDALLGVNSLYTDVLTALSFAELGFGTALVYAMYAPVARNDTEYVIKLLDYYKWIYRIIAGIVAILGIAIIPFLQYLVKNAKGLTLFELRLYFAIFLFNTVTSYFVTYKFSYLNALQKNYLSTNINTAINFVTVIVQIIVILVFRNFLLYLLAQSLIGVLSKIFVIQYLDRKFPILKEKPEVPLSREEKQPIFNEVRGLVVHQFSSVAVHQTDSMIISSLTGLGVIAVGFVNNYNLLINGVLGFVVQVFHSFTSGFGNLAAESSKERFREVFYTANFINFWMYGFCSIAFFVLVPPFITLWLGPGRLIDTMSFLLIIINCYLQGQCIVYGNARAAVGNFNKDKWWSFTQAIVNLVVSIVCAKAFGLVGVYIGTVTSRLVYVIFRPYSTYSMMFEESCKRYYIVLAKYFLSTAFAGAVTYALTYKLLASVTIVKFILAVFIVGIVPNLIILVMYFRSREFKGVTYRLKLLRSKKNG